MDPFGTAGAAIGVVDVCVRLANYVRQIQKDAASIQRELTALDDEIDDLARLCQTLEAASAHAPPPSTPQLPDTKETTANSDLWKRVSVTFKSCQYVLSHMGGLLQEIYGEKPDDEALRSRLARHLDNLKKVHRKRSREEELQDARKRLDSNMSTLQFLFTAISR